MHPNLHGEPAVPLTAHAKPGGWYVIVFKNGRENVTSVPYANLSVGRWLEEAGYKLDAVAEVRECNYEARGMAHLRPTGGFCP